MSDDAVEINFDKENIKKRKEYKNTVFIKSRFNFLSAHNGLRPGCIHILMGVTSSGKSSLTRAIITDSAKHVSNCVLVWLSEETTDEYEEEFIYSPDINETIAKKIKMFSEHKIKNKDVEETKEKIVSLIKKHKPRLFVFDNLTTSFLYNDRKVSEQSKFIGFLKEVSAETKVPFLLVAHTGAQINESYRGIIDESNIRGSKTVGNEAHFFYILQKFTIGNLWAVTLRVKKHRGQDVDNQFYRLVYTKEFRTYTHDLKIDWKEFSSLFKLGNKL